MASGEHVRILRSGATAWNEWRRTNSEIRPELRHADFDSIDLHDVDLRDLDLCDTYFTGTNLSGADLRGAYLVEANFNRANLSATRFADATMGNTILSSVNLSTALGLEHVNHKFPSYVGVDTLFLSNGKIPHEFLHGAGVPESLIATARQLLDEMAKDSSGLVIDAKAPVIHLPHRSKRSSKADGFYSCFVSYSHADKVFANRLYDELKKRRIRCWLDEHQMLPGNHIPHEVDREIRRADKFLLLCSKSSLESWWVENELAIFFEKEQQLQKERRRENYALIPIDLDKYLFSDQWKSGYRSSIRTRAALDFTNTGTDRKKFAVKFKTLLLALRVDPGDRTAPPASEL